MGKRLRANDRVFHAIDSDSSFNCARGERSEYWIEVNLLLGHISADIVRYNSYFEREYYV